MIYVCIPAHDEGPTVGLLLWRIRKVFEEFPREYQFLVGDDASTDGTAEILEPYQKVLCWEMRRITLPASAQRDKNVTYMA